MNTNKVLKCEDCGDVAEKCVGVYTAYYNLLNGKEPINEDDRQFSKPIQVDAHYYCPSCGPDLA